MVGVIVSVVVVIAVLGEVAQIVIGLREVRALNDATRTSGRTPEEQARVVHSARAWLWGQLVHCVSHVCCRSCCTPIGGEAIRWWV